MRHNRLLATVDHVGVVWFHPDEGSVQRPRFRIWSRHDGRVSVYSESPRVRVRVFQTLEAAITAAEFMVLE